MKPTSIAAGSQRALRRTSRMRMLFIGCLALIGVLLSSGLYAYLSHLEQIEIQSEFSALAKDHIQSLQLQTTRIEGLLAGIADSVALSPGLTRRGFERLTAPLLALRADIQALEWIPRVNSLNRREYESEARREGLRDFAIRDLGDSGALAIAGDADEYFPVYFVEPREGNAAALGLNLASNASRRAALFKARDTANLTVTEPIRLVQEAHTQSGVLVIIPVFRSSETIETIDARRANLRGFVLGVVRVGDLVDQSLHIVRNDNLHVHMADGSTTTYGRNAQEGHASLINTVNIGDRKWSVTISATPTFWKDRESPRALMALTVGLILTAGVCTIVFVLVTARKDAERAKDLMGDLLDESESTSAALRAANVDLEGKTTALAMASKYKSEFLANMSHELRTPLNSLLILAESLRANKKGNLTTDQVNSAKVILCGGKDLLSMINDILDLSKIEAGKMDVNQAPVSWLDVQRSILSQFSPISAHKGVDFRFDILSGVPPEIQTDQQRLEQILRNLLSNAFKFTSQGSVVISIGRAAPGTRFGRDDLTSDSVVAVSVVDTGIGIAADNQAAIFEAFQQEDGSTCRRFGGTGLGLTISRNFADLLGGEIQLQSTEGEGSSFTLYLPARMTSGNQHDPLTPRRAESDDCVIHDRNENPGVLPVVVHADRAQTQSDTNGLMTAANGTVTKEADSYDQLIDEVGRALHATEALLSSSQQHSIEATPKPNDDLTGARVLLVDDDMRNVFALSQPLEDAGLDVSHAENGQVALDMLNACPDLDIVIMDVMMPVMDGHAAMRAIRKQERFKDLPIIALTARAMPGDRAMCLESGANDCQTKPVDVSGLLSLIRVWVCPSS